MGKGRDEQRGLRVERLELKTANPVVKKKPWQILKQGSDLQLLLTFLLDQRFEFPTCTVLLKSRLIFRLIFWPPDLATPHLFTSAPQTHIQFPEPTAQHHHHHVHCTHTHTLKHVHVHTHTCTYTHTHPNPTPSATQWLLECPCSTSSPDKSLPNPWGHSSLFVSLESQWPSWTIMCLFPYQSTCWPKMKASSLLWLAWSSATNLTLQALSGLF